ncbi:hypothetical protein [Paenibacillus polymyxa]|uniref:hypothetical protein n=1 Tax=Paenibacillus polymyxa TaxID=1406 RepID=UPI002AB43891|nr:hypothetical protein [Paenibacillus polymyxa]MDY8021766.1 hypothetical protein [Paenibacillus polymyxa]
MSRSVKKSPFKKDQATRWVKRQASKAVRRYTQGVSSGSWYKKVYCSWNICDFRILEKYQQAMDDWVINHTLWNKQMSYQEAAKEWAKHHKWK